MDADLENALRTSLKTTARVTSNGQATRCIEESVDFWIRMHLGAEWTIIQVELTLVTHVLSAQGKLMTRKNKGILQKYDFQGFFPKHLLFIYQSDKYTESWVHSLALRVAHDRSHRILNIERNDPGEAIDLGDFKLG